MQRSSSAGWSWRFEVGDATALSVALRCRDELAPPVLQAVDAPPPTTSVPSPATTPDPGLPGHWLAWWRRLLDRTAAGVRPDPLTGEVPRSRRLVTVPDALALIDHDLLLSRATDAARREVEASRAMSPPPGGEHRPPVPWSVVDDAVFDTAGRTQVALGDLWGGIHLVPGPVGWCAVVRPGYGLMTATGDEASDGDLYRFVCDVLESCLHAPGS